jgi:DNA-binding winged helix-turn-helix (wHTH) protein
VPNIGLGAQNSGPKFAGYNRTAGVPSGRGGLITELERELSELPGEDLNTSALPEVAGWISIYEEMAGVLRSVISRANGNPDVPVLKRNLLWIDHRLAAWRDRHAELAGVVIDRTSSTLTYAGKSLPLTRREADLLDFLLRHPQRPFTSKQLATLAWQNSRLSDAQVRTYIMRLRARLAEVGLAHVITVARNRGYGINAEAGITSE